MSRDPTNVTIVGTSDKDGSGVGIDDILGSNDVVGTALCVGDDEASCDGELDAIGVGATDADGTLVLVLSSYSGQVSATPSSVHRPVRIPYRICDAALAT